MSIEPLLLTLQLIAAAVTIAAIIGIVGAWSTTVLRQAGRLGASAAVLFRVAMVTAVATPLVLHAAAWEATAGKFGWWMMTQSGARSGGFGSFSGLLATGWIHGIFGAAMVALAVGFGAGRTPVAVIRQSRLDLGATRRWWSVSLPIAAPWLIASLLATGILAATEMTVADLYGYRTIADTFYLYHAVDPSPMHVLWTCALPWALAALLLSWLLILRRRVWAVQTPRESAGSQQEPVPAIVVAIAATAALLIAAAVVLVPVTGLVIKAGHTVTLTDGQLYSGWSATACLRHIAEAPRLFASEYKWTALIGISTGFSSVLLAWPLAMVGRSHRAVERVLDLTSVLVFAVPGPIVGMAVVELFQRPWPGSTLLYQQTIVPTVIALSLRAVPIAYWVLRSGYRGIGDKVLDVSRLDLSLLYRLWHIHRPLLNRHLILAALAAALFATGDVPAMLPVIPAGVTTVGTRLFELLHAGARHQEASLAFWHIAAAVGAGGLLAVLFRGYRGRS